MILNIFNDIWSKLVELTNNFYDFIMNHFDDPFLWITIVVVLLVITYGLISNIANK